MSFENMVNELLALASELYAIDKEYEFARGRAEAHSEKATAGDAWSRWTYCGAVSRMNDLRSKAVIIEQRITELELQYAGSYATTNRNLENFMHLHKISFTAQRKTDDFLTEWLYACTPKFQEVLTEYRELYGTEE